MSLFRIDGWDYYPPNSTGQTVVGPNFTADGFSAGLNNWTTTTGRFGTGNSIWLGANFVSFEALGRRFTTETVVIGQAVRMDTSGLFGGGLAIYDAMGASFLQCGIGFFEDGVIRVVRGNGGSGSLNGVIVATSKNKVIHPQEWNYIEIKFKLHASSGLVEVRVNTVVVVSYVGPTTHMTVTPILGLPIGWDTIAYNGFSNLQYDDRYILDDVGTDNIDYLGNVRVNTQLTVGAGDLTQMSVFGAANNWDAVNEFVLTDAEYVYTSTIGNSDLYAMNPSITAQNIFGVQVVGAWRQDDATQMRGQSLIKTHGTVYEGALTNELAQTYHYYRDVYDLNPNTGVGWTAAELNAIQAGQKLLAG